MAGSPRGYGNRSIRGIRRQTVNLKDFYEQKYVAGEEIVRTSKVYTLAEFNGDQALKILDVGCGTGLNSEALRAMGHMVQGVDISQAAIEQYEAKGFTGKAGNLEAGLDFPDAAFDAVLFSEVVEHLTMPERVLDEINRVLKPGGKLVLSTPNSAFWVYRVGAVFGYTLSELQHPKHFQFFSIRSLRKALTAAHFRIGKVTGRNMYMIVSGAGDGLPAAVLSALGFTKEIRFRTKKPFWHLSHKSSFFNSLFADTLIVVARKE